MTEFKFVDNPPLPRDSGHRAIVELLEEFAAALRGRPGAWAIYPGRYTKSSARTLASSIKKGLRNPFPKGDFDAYTVDGVCYVRYIGEGEPVA